MTDNPTRVGVILGGRSSEREVSLASGRQVFYNLDRGRFQPLALFMDRAGRIWQIPEKLVIQNTCADVEQRLADQAERVGIEDLPERVDVVFNALHGKYGDDGCIQGALELVDLPYTGSGLLACALSMDKPAAHALLAAQGFAVPREIVIEAADWQADREACIGRVVEAIGMPAVVLPAREGSSVGVTVVEDGEGLYEAVDAALAYDRRALVEEFLDGMEFSVILTGNAQVEAFLPTETTTENPFMTYDDKYMPGRSQKITPARVDEAALARIQSEAVAVYRAMGFQGYARLDGFLQPDGKIYFTDPNSTSGMSPSSFLFHQAAEAGLAPMQLVTRLIDLALEAHAHKRGPL